MFERHRKWRLDPVSGARVYKPRCVPNLDIRNLPPNVGITIPLDGGFWLVEKDTGIRFRRVTMADMPPHRCWNTNGGRQAAD